MFTTITQTLRINKFGQVYSMECQAESLETNDETEKLFFGYYYTSEFLDFSENINPVFIKQKKRVESILKGIEEGNGIRLQSNKANIAKFKNFTAHFENLLENLAKFALTSCNLYIQITGNPGVLESILYKINRITENTLPELSLYESFNELDDMPLTRVYFHRVFTNLKKIIDSTIFLKGFFQTNNRFVMLKKHEDTLKQLNIASFEASEMIETIQNSFIQLTSINMATTRVSEILVNTCDDGSLETKKPGLYSSELVNHLTTTDVPILMDKQSDLEISNISNNRVADESVVKSPVPFITNRINENSKLIDIKTEVNSTRGIENFQTTNTSIYDRIINTIYNCFKKVH